MDFKVKVLFTKVNRTSKALLLHVLLHTSMMGLAFITCTIDLHSLSLSLPLFLSLSLSLQITLPVPEDSEEKSGNGRPKALQVETSAITAKNHTLDTLLTNENFTMAMKRFDQGWVFDSQETGQFPHYSNDLRSLPAHLWRLLNHKPRGRGRSSTLKDSNSPSSSGGRAEKEREKERDNRLYVHVHAGCSFCHRCWKQQQ